MSPCEPGSSPQIRVGLPWCQDARGRGAGISTGPLCFFCVPAFHLEVRESSTTKSGFWEEKNEKKKNMHLRLRRQRSSAR